MADPVTYFWAVRRPLPLAPQTSDSEPPHSVPIAGGMDTHRDHALHVFAATLRSAVPGAHGTLWRDAPEAIMGHRTHTVACALHDPATGDLVWAWVDDDGDSPWPIGGMNHLERREWAGIVDQLHDQVPTWPPDEDPPAAAEAASCCPAGRADCEQCPELAAILGHGPEAHRVLATLRDHRIATLNALLATELANLPDIGPSRRAFITTRLRHATAGLDPFTQAHHYAHRWSRSGVPTITLASALIDAFLAGYHSARARQTHTPATRGRRS